MSRLAVCIPALLLVTPAYAQRLSLSTRSTWYTRVIDLGLGWVTLLITIIFVVMIWKRIKSWSQSRLEPALDALRVASGELAARSAGTEMTPFSRHKHINGTLDPIELCGEPWIRPGQLYSLEASDKDAIPNVVLALLRDPKTSVIVVSDRFDLRKIATHVEADAPDLLENIEGRLFSAAPTSLATMPDALLYDAARSGHLPMMVIDHTALDVLGHPRSFTRLAELLKPAALRLDGAAIVICNAQPKSTTGYDRVRRWRDGKLS
jgi:hypothetical protein